VFEPAAPAPPEGAPQRTLAAYLAAAEAAAGDRGAGAGERGAAAGHGGGAAAAAAASPASFRNAFVYVVGGACYTEEADIAAWAAAAARTVVYGGTDMVSPASFLAQLRTLGEQTAEDGAGR